MTDSASPVGFAVRTNACSMVRTANPTGIARAVRRWLHRALLGGFLLCLLAPAIFWSCVWLWPYPADASRMPPESLWLEDSRGIELASFAADDGQWRMILDHAQFSATLLNAIVAAEDIRFYDHGGVDWRSVLGACRDNITSLRFRRGASTLTMQLHRLRCSRERTLWGKFEQAVRATQIERAASKQEILTEYLNRAPFGGNLVGAGAASWRYFRRSPADLTLAQAALLAGLPQSPNRFRPDRHPDRALDRRNQVLARMLRYGMIGQNEHDQAAAQSIEVAAFELAQRRTADEGLLPSLLESNGQQRGLVRLTIDSAIQRSAAAAARRQLDEYRSSGIGSAAVVVLNTQTAEVLASVSFSDQAPLLDLTRRPRSTGSAVKPFIYAAAFDAGICAPATILNDGPANWPDYRPDNYDHVFRGQITAAAALAESRNIPALHLLSLLGVERAAGIMQSIGLRRAGQNPRRAGLTLAIGGAESSPLELAEAYATLARGGVHWPTRLFPLPPGKGWGEGAQVGELLVPLISTDACYETLSALSDPDRTARLCPEARGSHIAWKTGTSSGHRDAWCAAVTPRYTVVAWLGNARGEGSIALVGAEAAAPLALQIINQLDPSVSPWPAVVRPDDNRGTARTPPARLAILSPADGLQIAIDPGTPAASQKVRLKASAQTAVWWFVDNQLLAEPTQELWWPPKPGRHEIRAVTANGESARCAITVR